MSEAMFAACLLSAALLSSVAGMGWLALSMPVHAQQVWGSMPTSMTLHVLRWIGTAGLAAALGLCLIVDHASMAVLVWVMASAGASLLIAFTLTWYTRWLCALAPWVNSTVGSAGDERAADRS
ncbi:MAG TPA: DUF3325 domain-containing protein [Pseudoxanthomonas sp.]|nr:DUF3325 domain-containing protein [Pseudoxanthomonas sp.]